MEQQAIMLVGTTIFKKLVKEYTEKQWHRNCNELPSFIIKRIPLRFTYDNNYFDDCYQGIPVDGYTALVEKMLYGIDVLLNTDYLDNKAELRKKASAVIFTGPIDEYFNFELGVLEYRSLRFEFEEFDFDNYQNNAVINYTSHSTPYTRIIEHKFFNNMNQPKTIISREYPDDWQLGKERFYTINNEKNNALYQMYLERAQKEENVYFGGRLGMYKYFDMDDTIGAAFKLIESLIGEKKA